MCLILVAYRTHPEFPLIIAANRDEQHQRASAPLAFWPDQPNILAGRDLLAHGTWLGVTRQGRFAALTNFSTDADPDQPISRGGLVHEFLQSHESAADYARSIQGQLYAGFNLLLWDNQQLVYASNRATRQILQPGCFGLANAELGAAWPKCVDGAEQLRSTIADGIDHQTLISLLRDEAVAPDEQLPQRGRPLELERRISPRFINATEYGTRASSIVAIGHSGLSFSEQTYLAAGEIGQLSRQDIQFEE